MHILCVIYVIYTLHVYKLCHLYKMIMYIKYTLNVASFPSTPTSLFLAFVVTKRNVKILWNLYFYVS